MDFREKRRGRARCRKSSAVFWELFPPDSDGGREKTRKKPERGKGLVLFGGGGKGSALVFPPFGAGVKAGDAQKKKKEEDQPLEKGGKSSI